MNEARPNRASPPRAEADRPRLRGSNALAAQKRLHLDALCPESLLEDRHAFFGRRFAAHEHVERCIAAFGPTMDGDMALRQNSHTPPASVRFEVVQVNVQKRRAGSLDAGAQRLVDTADI